MAIILPILFVITLLMIPILTIIGKDSKSKDSKSKIIFLTEILTIKDLEIRNAAAELTNLVPDYFWKVAASSSGKYHPKTDLGEGGLVRHSINVKRMLDHLLTPNGYFPMTDREKDLLRVAALFHDSFKSGTQQQYEENQHTKFLHPIYASNFIKDNLNLPAPDVDFICSAVESHMGQWNTSKHSSESLPTPETTPQKALHLADYLASRKGIEMEIDN